MSMSGNRRLPGKRILLGVSGSIAAYKAVSLLRRLQEEGADVSVVMTQSATQFVAPLTFETLSHHPVAIDLFAVRPEMAHLTLPDQADVFIVAPATANILAKCAMGMADDLLSTMLLSAACPLIFVPAMDGGMWEHPAVQANVVVLRSWGVTILEPEEGALASGRVGRGRFPDEGVILSAIERRVMQRRSWTDQRVLVSAGPTQEPIDAVRFLSNRSSGKMGYAIAQAARERGAEVVLVSGPTALAVPPGVECLPVDTAEEMSKALLSRFPWATVVIMAAAVADFRPARPTAKKLKKQATVTLLELEPTEDIVSNLARRRTSQVIVGFAAETESVVLSAREKLQRKDLDLIVGNNVAEPGSGFGSETSAAVLIDRTGRITEMPVMSKRALADRILDAVEGLRQDGSTASSSDS
jgi:phosphopantothenoylcysteine decarboxylase/phosphopantothenate--cysteine ligase